MITGARCLDLFAGTGALGLEAQARGAANSVFVERDRVLTTSLNQALDTLGATATATVRNSDWRAGLASADDHFDVIFLDPPFDQPLLEPALVALPPTGAVAPGVSGISGTASTHVAGWLDTGKEQQDRARRFALVRFTNGQGSAPQA